MARVVVVVTIARRRRRLTSSSSSASSSTSQVVPPYGAQNHGILDRWRPRYCGRAVVDSPRRRRSARGTRRRGATRVAWTSRKRRRRRRRIDRCEREREPREDERAVGDPGATNGWKPRRV